MADSSNITLPQLHGLVDPKAELQLYLAFKNMYQYINTAIKTLEDSLSKKVTSGQLSSSDLNSLIGAFSQPLAGSTTTDPLLQSIIQSFGSQAANLVFASPDGSAGNPNFRTIAIADLPNAIPLSKLDQKILKTDDGLTETTAAAPYANSGYITIKDNNGHTKKVMTTNG